MNINVYVISVLLFLIGHFIVGANVASAKGQDLLSYETSFEDAADRTWLTFSTEYDESQSYNGARALKYTISQSTSNPSMKIDLRPNNSYHVDVWIKTSGMSGESAGARLGLDAYDVYGNWIGGSWSDPIASNDGWSHIKLPTYTAVGNAAYADVTLYSQGDAGTIWFDDLTITETQPATVTSMLISPSYRGLLMPGQDQRVKVAIQAGYELDHEAYNTQVELLTAEGEVIDTWTAQGIPGTVIEFDAVALSAGEYSVIVRTTTEDPALPKSSQVWPLRKLGPDDEKPTSYVDAHGRFWKDGELFFPIGMYTANVASEDLNDLRGSAINTILPYTYPTLAQLNLAEHHGMQVIFSLKDFFYGMRYTPDFIRSEEDEVTFITTFVNQYKNHPALLAWYLSDETPDDERLVAHYEAVVENDPNHPAYSVDFRPPDPYVLAQTTDIFGLDVYPVQGRGNDDVGQPGALQKEVTGALFGKGQWAVVQAHNLGNYPDGNEGLRPPTLDEMRNMAWQYITEGARGIIFYSLFDLKQDASGARYEDLLANVKTVAGEIADMVPVIFSSEESLIIDVPDADWLHVMAKKHEGTAYIVAVNTSQNVQELILSLPDFRGNSARVKGAADTLPVLGGILTDHLPSLAVRIYELDW